MTIGSKRLLSSGVALSAVAALVSACSSAPPPTDTGSAAASDSDPPPIFRTAVHVHADGTQSITSAFVSRAQSDADALARGEAQEARARGEKPATPSPDYVAPSDPNCAASDVWLYDGNGSGGTCPPPHTNEICFAFDPNATNGALDATYVLSNYPKCDASTCFHDVCRCLLPVTWAEGVGAFWPGASAGFIEGREPPGPVVFASFSSYGACQTATGSDQVPLQYPSFLALSPPP